jgi:hypothetical protein
MFYPSYSPVFEDFNNIQQAVQIMKFLIMQFSTDSYYFLSLRSKHSPQHCSKTLSVYVPPLMWETKFQTFAKQQLKLQCYIFIFPLLGNREEDKNIL